MKKNKISPGQLDIFSRVVYSNRCYANLKDAMLSAMQDFYIKKIYPEKIKTIDNVYAFREMKKFWEKHGFYDFYIY